MTQHTELTDDQTKAARWLDEVRQYLTAAADSSMSRNNSEQLAYELLEALPANALEAQAREIAGLQAARMAYASEFPPDGEGEPDVGSIHQNIRAMKAEIAELKAQEAELCTLYGLAQAECQKLRAELERTANNRDMWKSQCERQADELRKLRKDAECVFTYKTQPGNLEAWRFGDACREAQPGGDPIDHGLSLLQKLQEKGYGIVAIDATKEGQP